MFCLFMMLVLLPLFFICEKCSKPVPLKSRTLAQTMLVYQPRRKRSKLLFCFYKIQYRYRQMTGKLNLFTDQFRSYNQVCGIQFLDQPDHPVYPSSLPSVSCWLLGTNRYFRGGGGYGVDIFFLGSSFREQTFQFLPRVSCLLLCTSPSVR